jgi:hypothetical protein
MNGIVEYMHAYLQHFDANEGVEGFFEFCRDLAIVHEVNPNAILKAGFLDPLFC